MPTTAQTTRAQTATQTSPTTTNTAASTSAPAATPARIVNPAPPVLSLGAAAPKPDVNLGSKGAGRGQPLAPGVRAVLEKRLGVDLSAVRVHTEQVSSAAVGAVSARALTRGTDIFLGKDERPTDLALIAHEVAHIVQQRGAPAQVQHFSSGEGDACEREAQRAAAAAVRGEQFTVRERTRAPRAQRLGLSDALDYFADHANLIPGFRMFTIVLGVNPINMSPVARSAANIMRAVVEFIPGGGLVTRALDTYDVFERVGAWVEGQIGSLGMSGSAIRQAVMDFVRSLSWSDIFDLGGVWERARRIFTAPIDRIIGFARGLITGILGFVREAVLRPLARLAQNTAGYDLLKAVLGQDPVTGEAVPRNADTLIGGFMKLIGQEEVWNNLKRANAVARAWAWFQGALSGLMGFVRQIPGMIVSMLRSITIEDFLPITNLFGRVVRTFGGFFGSFLSWAGGQVMSLLEIIFEVVAPSVMPYIRRAAGALRTIIRNPIGFVGNLVRAGVQGFRQFAGNFLNHLRASLVSWLTGTLSGAGVYIPQSFSLMEIVKFILSVLGLTWQNIRAKLVRVIGETTVRVLETGFDLVVTLVTQGPAAAWQKILEGISNLREMVIEQIMSFVRERVVQAAITRLLTSLNPAGAFIQAIIATYNTVMFFVERMRQIGQVVAAYIDSISAIAAGNIGSAANRVETTMAGLLTLVISFLARIAGLGRVSDAVVNIINRVRAPIDRALDRVVEWIVNMARRVGRFFAQAGLPQDPNERLRLGMQAAISAVNRFSGRRVGAVVLTPLLSAISTRYGFATLEPFERNGRWWVRARINPQAESGSEAQTERGQQPSGPDSRTPEEKNRDLRLGVGEASTIVADNSKGRTTKRREIERIRNQYRLASLEMIRDSHTPGRDTVHIHGEVNPTFNGQGVIINPFPPEPKIVIQTEIGAPQARQRFERVLTPPSQVGLAGYERAHLLGAGFGAESPLGIFYTPSQVNQDLQNRGIEGFIRGIFANRVPGARFFIRASAEPHPGTQILARVTYTLSGQLPGEPVTDIFETRIIIKDATLTPRIIPQGGEIDEEVFGRYTSFINSSLSNL
ncbi:MAG: DUF4157 domain-containing protein [Pyrinomonadaceae bacterium]